MDCVGIVIMRYRLSTEHGRLVDLIREVEFPGLLNEQVPEKSKKRASSGESTHGAKKTRCETKTVLSPSRVPVIADMMGGVGPFGIPLAKLNLFHVHCNDLNPESYKYMLQNARLNRCTVIDTDDSQPGITCYNLDGREFIRRLRSRGVLPDHVIMNLPQTAPDFLDTFIGYSANNPSLPCKLPVIHVYTFSTAVENLPTSAIADVTNRCASIMGCSPEELGTQQTIPTSGIKLANTIGEMKKGSVDAAGSFFENICWGHIVRDVAPTKVMVCLSFRLPYSVAERS